MASIPSTGQQDACLNDWRKRRQLVAIYLVNGLKLTGVIESFDRNVLLVRHGTMQELVFKHMVSTIMPTAKGNMKPAASDMPGDAETKPEPVVVTRKGPRRPFTSK